jgi:hypothetical protein
MSVALKLGGAPGQDHKVGTINRRRRSELPRVPRWGSCHRVPVRRRPHTQPLPIYKRWDCVLLTLQARGYGHPWAEAHGSHALR